MSLGESTSNNIIENYKNVNNNIEENTVYVLDSEEFINIDETPEWWE